MYVDKLIVCSKCDTVGSFPVCMQAKCCRSNILSICTSFVLLLNLAVDTLTKSTNEPVLSQYFPTNSHQAA